MDTVDDIYVNHHHWLVNWLKKKMGCTHSAADLAQDTFIRLLLLPDVASLKTPRAYLTTTATHLLIDHARRQKLEQAYLQALAISHADSYSHSPEDYKQAIDTLIEISNMLQGLPEKARRAFLMSRLEEASHADIALQLGVSVSMVKQYIASALMHCYKLIHGVPKSGEMVRKK